MDFKDISVPEIYKTSQDFRFFLDWFSNALNKIKYDTENLIDLYDPLRCPTHLIWTLADTMGYKYDDRLPASFNRLVLMYFMSMIRNKGSKNGITLAAETNLAQFNLLMQANGYTDENNVNHPGKKILYDRLDDTSIPVNSVYVTAHTSEGYIDIVYFSTELPKDACIEYVRPLGMYCFQHAGVRFDSRTKINIDARLTNINDTKRKGNNGASGKMNFGPTQVGHYSRGDYASIQTFENDNINKPKTRREVWQSNKANEAEPNPKINPGLRALYSLQLSNNEQIVKSLIDPIFSLGYGTDTEVNLTYVDNYLKYPDEDYYSNGTIIKDKPWNLRYNKDFDLSDVANTFGNNVTTFRNNENYPKVNPHMGAIGDSISMNSENTEYTDVDSNTGNISIVSDEDKKNKDVN